MPLARAALYQKGITIYISCNTNDNEEWQSTIRHIALEGRCFFINADQNFTKDIYPSDLHEPVWDKEEIIYEELAMNEVPASGMELTWSDIMPEMMS